VLAKEGQNTLIGLSEIWGPLLTFANQKDIGLIAQDVEKVFPELVAENEQGYKGIAYSKLTAVLVEAIKEQQGQIATLEQENTQLEALVEGQMTEQEARFTAQITALEKENTQLKVLVEGQMEALLARVAMLEGESLAAN
jgi:hypothetical protein